MLKQLAIKYLQWYLKRKKINNIEFVIRSDCWTYHKRNKYKEESIKKTLELIN